jgi:hypothetical protein
MQQQLKKLFKPFKLEFQTMATVRNKSTRLRKIFDEDRIIKRLETNQCSKSKNRLCANADCQHNLLKYNYFDGDGT